MAKTFEILKASAVQIKEERRWGMNTAERVGRLFFDIIAKVEEISVSGSPTAPSTGDGSFEPQTIAEGSTGSFEPN